MNSENDNSINQVSPEKKDQSYQSWSDRRTDKKNAPDEHKENHYEKEIIDPSGADSDKEVEDENEN
jgi:hypothetical protein